MTAVKEIVMVSGRFARVRPLTVGDLMALGDASKMDGLELLARIAARVTKVDEREVTFQEIVIDEYEDWAPVFAIITGYLKMINDLRGKGIA